MGAIADTLLEAMIFLWRIPEDYPEELVGEYQRSVSPDRFLFQQGRAVPVDMPLPVVKTTAPLQVLRKYSCLPNNSMVPLLDQRLAGFLSKHAPQDIQLIKVRVIASDGETGDYCILNVTNKVPCVDHRKSEYAVVPGTTQIMSFRNLQLLDGCLGHHALARDANYLPHLLVSEELADALVGAGFTGLELKKPNEIAW